MNQEKRQELRIMAHNYVDDCMIAELEQIKKMYGRALLHISEIEQEYFLFYVGIFYKNISYIKKLITEGVPDEPRDESGDIQLPAPPE